MYLKFEDEVNGSPIYIDASKIYTYTVLPNFKVKVIIPTVDYDYVYYIKQCKSKSEACRLIEDIVSNVSDNSRLLMEI